MMSATTDSVHMVNGATVCMPYRTFISVRSPADLASNSAKSVCDMKLLSFFFALLRLAQRLFLDAARARAALQFRNHVRRREVQPGERDHAVEPQVRHFGHHLGGVAA